MCFRRQYHLRHICGYNVGLLVTVEICVGCLAGSEELFVNKTATAPLNTCHGCLPGGLLIDPASLIPSSA